ncbi:MAG: AAA family ATPase [Acidimicrobiia bacterium]|nr:AAA family ATPase [Acidimicrobiia bacterium]
MAWADAPDLFSAAAATELGRRAPLAERLRPARLDEVVGQDHLLGPGKPLRALVDADRLSSVILWGPPGTGKTTLARLIARASSSAMIELSAVSASVKDVREVTAGAERRLGEHGQGTILFLDEVHRFNRAQQDALLPSVESGLVVLIGATTENPYFEVNPPLLSRSVLFHLEPLSPDAVAGLVARGLEMLGATAGGDAVDQIAELAGGDARHALGVLDVAVALAGDGEVRSSHVSAALGTKAVRYGVEGHYDAISALIKSVRGSDPDAGLYWLAQMLEAGDDPRFVARRLVILASEDVGLADPQAIVVATAAAHALELVGLPEARLSLAEAVVYLATAPKSNRVYTALAAATEDVRRVATTGVPLHLRGAGYRGAADLGHGVGYRYPHDEAEGWVDQAYRPDEVVGHRYYSPSSHGFEGRLGARWWPNRRLAEHGDEDGEGASAGPAAPGGEVGTAPGPERRR